MRKLLFIPRLVLGCVFLYAGFLKARSPESFAATIAAFRLLPRASINLFAMGLPMLEMLAGVLLLTGFRLRVGALSALVLTLVFAGALLSLPIRGLDIDCGCFGADGHSTSITFALGRDILLAGMALVVYLRSPARVQGNDPR